MRLGIGIGIPRGRQRAAVGGEGIPPVLLTAQLVLDSRQGITLIANDAVEIWENLVDTGIDDFFENGPRLRYAEEDAQFKGQPSLLSEGNSGNVANDDTTGQLNFLHDGSDFTMMITVAGLVDSGDNQIIFGNTGSGAAIGTQFAVSAAGDLSLYIYNAGGVTLVLLQAPWANDGGTHTITVRYNGTDYFLLIDNVEVDTVSSPGGHNPANRTLPYYIGSLGTAATSSDAKIAHVYLWNTDIGEAGVTTMQEYIESIFHPIFPAAYLDADLVLDSRVGVQIDGDNNVVNWANQGLGGSDINFSRAVPPYLIYDPADASFNGAPSLEQIGDAGGVSNEDFSTLNYLHNGSAFTIVAVISHVAGGGNSTILAGATTPGNLGILFRITPGGQLDFFVYDGVGFIQNISTPWPVDGAPHVVAVQWEGTEGSSYNLWIDGTIVNSQVATADHATDDRNVPYTFLNHPAATTGLDGKGVHLGIWDSNLDPAAIALVTDYLLETFAP